MTGDRLTREDLLDLDYQGKQALLEEIARELLRRRVEYVEAAGKAAELRANIQVLGLVKSSLQSALRAERQT